LTKSHFVSGWQARALFAVMGSEIVIQVRNNYSLTLKPFS